jgi:hypothetical protein
MKLEAGKKYVLKSGQVVGPMYDELQEDGETFLYMSNNLVDGYLPMWFEDGKADFFSNPKNNYPEHDILGEYVELEKLDESL